MLTPAFSEMSALQWTVMSSDTNGVESLNKCAIDHTNKSKSLESCLEFTYRQDKKMTLEHLYAYSGLPISLQRKTTGTYKQRAARQNKARRKRLVNTTETDDDVGLKGSIIHYNKYIYSKDGLSPMHAIITASSVKRPRKAQHSQSGGCPDSDSDFENKENNGIILYQLTQVV